MLVGQYAPSHSLGKQTIVYYGELIAKLLREVDNSGLERAELGAIKSSFIRIIGNCRLREKPNYGGEI